MVIPREDIRHQRTEYIKRRVVADSLLKLHIGFNLVHSHMAGAFYHYLNILCPSTLSQCAKLDKLGNLTCVGSVVDTARAQSVTERNGDIILAQYLKNIIIILIERILITRHHHPRKQQRAAAGYDIHLSGVASESFNGAAVDSRMDCHKIHALLGVRAYNTEEILGCDVKQILFKIADSVVHRNCAYHCGGFLNQRLSEGVGLAIVGKVHDSLCAEFQRHIHLLHLYVVILGVARNSEVYIDFRAQSAADSLCGKRSVVNVGGDCKLAGGNTLADILRSAVLLLGNGFHFGRDNALFRRFHLCFVFSHINNSFRGFYFLGILCS